MHQDRAARLQGRAAVDRLDPGVARRMAHSTFAAADRAANACGDLATGRVAWRGRCVRVGRRGVAGVRCPPVPYEDTSSSDSDAGQ